MAFTLRHVQRSVANSLRNLGRDCCGQDMIEYALMAAMVAIAVAAFVPYTILPSVSHIYSRLLEVAHSLTGA
jgi:Flp pilus assembly pilin Flp